MSDNQDTETLSGECGETQVGVQEASELATFYKLALIKLSCCMC